MSGRLHVDIPGRVLLEVGPVVLGPTLADSSQTVEVTIDGEHHFLAVKGNLPGDYGRWLAPGSYSYGPPVVSCVGSAGDEDRCEGL